MIAEDGREHERKEAGICAGTTGNASTVCEAEAIRHPVPGTEDKK
jgi:isoaspartyl peptidase/L-asparaginase-like protein (Ntn-hydrolase superfamily)